MPTHPLCQDRKTRHGPVFSVPLVIHEEAASPIGINVHLVGGLVLPLPCHMCALFRIFGGYCPQVIGIVLSV